MHHEWRSRIRDDRETGAPDTGDVEAQAPYAGRTAGIVGWPRPAAASVHEPARGATRALATVRAQGDDRSAA